MDDRDEEFKNIILRTWSPTEIRALRTWALEVERLKNEQHHQH